MAHGRKSVLSKDSIHLKQIYQFVFESVMIWVLFGGRGGRMYKTKAKICCKLYELELNPFKNWIKFSDCVYLRESPHPTPTLFQCFLTSITTGMPFL